MSLSCFRCRHSAHEKMYFSAVIDPERLARSGLLCPDCHDYFADKGKIIGYVPFNGDGLGWVRSILTLRSLHDTYATRDFRFQDIQRIASPISAKPRRDLRAQLQAVADVYGWIATTHGGSDTFEGWLFDTTAAEILTMLDDRRHPPDDQPELRRLHNVLAFHGAVVKAATSQRRQTLMQALVGMIAATYSTSFDVTSTGAFDTRGARRILRELIEQPARPMTAYRTLECLQTRSAWLIFLTSHVDRLAPASIARTAQMLADALQNQAQSFYRFEAFLRAIHWEVRFLNRLPEIAPELGVALESRQRSASSSPDSA